MRGFAVSVNFLEFLLDDSSKYLVQEPVSSVIASMRYTLLHDIGHCALGRGHPSEHPVLFAYVLA